jgi:hypothetical protein
VLLALVQRDEKFLWADVDGIGLASDAKAFSESELKEFFDDGNHLETLPDDIVNTLFLFPGHNAFHDVLAWQSQGLGHDERIYNDGMSCPGIEAEHAFEILLQSQDF